MLSNSLYKKKEKNRSIIIYSLAVILILIIGMAIGYSTKAGDQISKIESYLEENYVCYEREGIYGRDGIIFPDPEVNISSILNRSG